MKSLLNHGGHRELRVLFARAAAIVAAVACAATLTPIARAQGAGPTDPQIVGIVIGANKIDIGYAKVALQKSHNKEVRAFAQQMERDHGTVLKSVENLAAKLHVTPATSSTGSALESQATETTAKLKALSGEAFNKAYIDNEVAFHTTVIDAMKSTLIPDAKNPQLKDALQGALPLFQGHLEHAENIQKTLK